MIQKLDPNSPMTLKSFSFYFPNHRLKSISYLLSSLRTCLCCRWNKLPSEIAHTQQDTFCLVRGPLQWCLQNLQCQGCTSKICLACCRWLHCGRMGIRLCYLQQRIRSYWHHPSTRKRSEAGTGCCVLLSGNQIFQGLVTQVSFQLLGPFSSKSKNM